MNNVVQSVFSSAGRRAWYAARRLLRRRSPFAVCDQVRGYLGEPAVAEMEELPVTLKGDCDVYNGVHVNLDHLDVYSCRRFSTVLKVSLCQWLAEKRCAAWLRVPIEKSALISEAAQLGFRFHHADDTVAVLYMWLKPNSVCKIHPFATHQVGVAGCILNSETSEVLLVREKGEQHSWWKFPGGVADLGEDIATTAKREVLEETGLQTEFHGILAFRQLHNQPNSFGRSDLFFVCHMSPLTFDMRPCPVEIAACQWMRIDDSEQVRQTSPMTQQVLRLVRHGMLNGLRQVTIGCEQLPSVYSGRRMNVFSHLPLQDQTKE